MASSHSYRSPSPPPSKHTENLRSTKAENGSSLRRSFSCGGNHKPSALKSRRRFDPITPANSPSDFAVRRSISKESISLYSSKDCEGKENDEKDHNIRACKLQSHAKGSKNFMSPTISASSKFTPSPKKKVLVERNDPFRTSMSLSNGKAVFFPNMSRRVFEDSELKSEMATATLHNEETEGSSGINDDADLEKCELVRENPPHSRPVKNVAFSDVILDQKHGPEPFSESLVADSDHLHVELSAKDKVSLSESATSIAPLDADPLCPPYDPVNNYLSPRPRFLHYPNPRIEILSNMKNRLEDSLMGEFMSEKLSEPERMEEYPGEDSSPKEGFVVVPSADLVLGAEETEDDILLVGETYKSSPMNSSASSDDIISEKNCSHKPKGKPWALSWSFFFFSLFLMVIIAGVSIPFINPSALSGIVPKDLSIYEIIPSTEENVNWLKNSMNQLSISSAIFVSKLANKLRGSEKLGPLQLHYMNLTNLHESPWVGNHFLDDNNVVQSESEEKYDEYDHMGMNVDGFEEDEASEIEFSSEDETSCSEEEVGSDDILEEDELQPRDEIPEANEVFDEVQEQPTLSSVVEQSREEKSKDKLHATSLGDVTKDDSSDCADDNELLDLSYSTDGLRTWTEKDPTPENSQETPLANYTTAISSVLAAIFAVAAAMLALVRRSPISNDVAAAPNPPLSSMKHADQENTASGMSSLQQKSASFNRSTSEVQGRLEREANSSTLKRESSASFSSEFSVSPSYGSFTSYEKVDGEEKFLTPVRRSSRIRNLR